jgi:hypothetical protein
MQSHPTTTARLYYHRINLPNLVSTEIRSYDFPLAIPNTLTDGPSIMIQLFLRTFFNFRIHICIDIYNADDSNFDDI